MKLRKYFSAMLAFVLTLLMCTPAFGENLNNDGAQTTKEILIYEVYDGLYRTVKARSATNTIRISPSAQFEDIYSSTEQNQYYQKTNDDEFVKVSKVEFNLTDYDAFTDIQKYNIPAEVLDGITTMAAWAESTGNPNAKGVIFATNESTRSGTPNTFPKLTTKWNGMTFYHYRAYFTGLWTSWQTIASKGQTTASTLNGIKDLAVFAAGAASGTIGTAAKIYSGGRTCIEAWKNITGKTPIYGNTANKVMVDIKYDMYLKDTYFYDPALKMERLGCSSQRAYVEQVDTDTYMYTSTGGSRAEDTVYPRVDYRSPNYNNPEETAYDFHAIGWVETVKGKIHNTTILFNFPNFTRPSDWP